MNAQRPLPILALFITTVLGTPGIQAQCTNTAQWPFNPITPDASGALTTIDACSFQSEYSPITDIIAGAAYQFTASAGTFITVRQGTYNGQVLGFGYSPLSVVAATADDLFAHWNVDSTCATSFACAITTVQLFLNCTPPVFTVNTTNECDSDQFFVDVDILDIGDATSLGLSYTVNGGAEVTQSGLQTGSVQLGPFPNLSVIDLTVVHAEDSTCNLSVLDIINYACPIESCGPDTYTHCYALQEEYIRIYQGTSGFPIHLEFNSGGISPFGIDVLTIHDGLDDTAPVLYTGIGNNGDLTGVSAISTNPDHALTIKLLAGNFSSCADGDAAEWSYSVACLDCVPPTGVGDAVTTDCDLQQFTVDVIVNDLGSDAELEIANDAGVSSSLITGPGIYTVGPFPVGPSVEISLLNDQNGTCSTILGTFTNSFCPIQITCGEPAFEDSYCYVDLDAQFWLYQNTGPESLALLFTAGSIESEFFDHLTIYDGTDNTAPVIWDHTSNATVDLTGLLAISTGTAIYMEMSSDGIISCASGNFGIEEWFWTVGCLDCVQPVATYEVVLDCDNDQFYISTTITAIGSDTTITLTNTGGAPDVLVLDTGTYNSGPFALGALVSVNVVTDENALCGLNSPEFTSAPCPLIGCGPFQFELCYADLMDTTIVYQSPGPYPIAVLFNAGDIQVVGDYIEVYDGNDFQAPLIYMGNNNGDLSGLLFTSTNPENALCIRFVSDFFGSCESIGGFTPWNWSVSCLDCTNPAASFELIPDCLHHGYNIEVDVTSLGSATDLRLVDSWSLDTVNAIGLGTTIIGPIPVDVTAHITVLNSVNPLCRVYSQDFVHPSENCVITACETIGVEHCYANADTVWFVYQSGVASPVTISFAYGQLLTDDNVELYNGLDNTAQLVFAGNLGGQIGGLALSSSNPDNALTLRVTSDGSGSCATGEASPALFWTVGCGLVGETETMLNGFAIYPNPTTGRLHIRTAAAVHGTVHIEVLDVAGRLVVSERFGAVAGTTWAIDLDGLQAGNYAVRLTTAGSTWTEQLQVVR